MLRLPPFRYEPARSIADALERLAVHDGQALIVSGGTDLYANMKQRLFTPKVLVGLRPVAALRYLRFDPDSGLRIGALATLSDIANNPVIQAEFPALAEAALSISTPQLRNMGTIGGNICLDTRCNYYNQNLDWRMALGYCMKKDGDICRVAPKSPTCVAVNSSDTAPVLLVYGATIRLSSANGTRDVLAADFFRNDGMRAWARRPNEIVTEVRIPAPAAGARSAYRKLRLRNSFDFPILGIAASLEIKDGVCSSARIALGAVAPKPIEAPAAAAALVGTRLEPAALEAAAEAVFAVGKPLDNTSGSIPYRKRMLRVFARRALEACAAGRPEAR